VGEKSRRILSAANLARQAIPPKGGVLIRNNIWGKRETDGETKLPDSNSEKKRCTKNKRKGVPEGATLPVFVETDCEE
jgi:hypothetical protein